MTVHRSFLQYHTRNPPRNTTSQTPQNNKDERSIKNVTSYLGFKKATAHYKADFKNQVVIFDGDNKDFRLRRLSFSKQIHFVCMISVFQNHYNYSKNSYTFLLFPLHTAEQFRKSIGKSFKKYSERSTKVLFTPFTFKGSKFSKKPASNL